MKNSVEGRQTGRTKTISVVLGSYNRLSLLKKTIRSVRSELDRCGVSNEIIAIDGGSSDGAMKWLTRQKDIVTIVQHNRGLWRGHPVERRSWGYFMNLGFKISAGKYICMVSDDCLLLPGAIREGLKLFDELSNKGEKIGSIPFYFRDWPLSKEYFVNKEFGYYYVNHGLYLASAMREAGFADEECFQFYGADIDLGLKMRCIGYDSVPCPRSFVEHFSHANATVRRSNSLYAESDTDTLRKKWEPRFGKSSGSRDHQVFIDVDNLARTTFAVPLIAELVRRLIRDPIRTLKGGCASVASRRR